MTIEQHARLATKVKGAEETSGSEFDSLVKRNETKVKEALTADQRGTVSVTDPGAEGALSAPAKPHPKNTDAG